MTTIDPTYRSRGYESDPFDELASRPPPKSARSESSRDRQARVIDSDHGAIQYPRELFAAWTPSKSGHQDLEHAPVAARQTQPAEATPVEAKTNAAETQAPAKSAAETYTANPNEVARTNTRPDPKELLAFVRQQWPGISDEAAMTLIAQSSFETGGWRACWNNNLGNAKEPDPNKPHFYIVPLPESLPPAMAEHLVNNGQARYAEPHDIKKYGLTAKPGMVMIVITAPTSANRFKQVEKMTDGFQSWVSHMKKMADKDPAMMQAIESGDCKAFAKTLQKHGYFTGSESVYAGGMEAHKKSLTKKLQGES